MKVKFTTFILVTSWILLSTAGCFSQADLATSIPQITSDLVEEDRQVVLDDSPEPSTLVSTINPTTSTTHIPTIRATPSTIPSTHDDALETEIENDVVSITPTSTQVITPMGNIYLRTSAGISRFSLATEEIENLVSIEPDWDSLGFALSPDRQQLAYWLHEEGRSELWITNLEQWLPKRVFTVSDIEHETIDLWWLSENYLLLEPGYFDQRYSFFIPVRSYLINALQQSVAIETGSLIFGCSLAVSPQSNRIATWCPAIEGWTDAEKYFIHPPSYYAVFEGNGEYWLSELAPAEVFIEFSGLPEDIWSWSYQGEYVTFSTYDEVAKARTLYYIEAQGQSLITVEDDSSYYYALDWSPNQKFISFHGKCSVKGCDKIYDILSRQVIWTSAGFSGTFLYWSYDSRYIVVLSEGITIIDIKTGESIRNFRDLSGGVIVWTP